jgi:menaquinone-dependent protoporphyrinogen oxidase
VNAAKAPVSSPVADYGAAIVLASAHVGRYEEEVTVLVKQRKVALSAIPSAFVSVSLSQASAENIAATPKQRAKGDTDAKAMIYAFVQKTGWKPDRTKAVAGAVPCGS